MYKFLVMTALVANVCGESSAEHHARLSEEQKGQVVCALAAFNTITAKEVIYVSTPITSGKRLYDYMEAKGFATIEEAKKDWKGFVLNVITPNIEESERTSAKFALETDGAVIAPTAFEKRFHGNRVGTWGQDTFMSMWLALLEEHVTHLVMLDGWHYSNGASEEYVQAVKKGILITDAGGNKITLDQGVQLLQKALDDIHGRDLKAPVLVEVLAELMNLG